MYWTTPSGTRYQMGSPRRLRERQSVDEIAGAGISTTVTRSAGRAAEGGLGHGVAGPGAADELGEVEQLVGIAPGEDLGQRVGTGDEVELRIRHRAP